jgi:hypothetical protein
MEGRPDAAPWQANMAVTTLVIAIIGAATGIGSLAWQMVTFSKSGPVVTVTATVAFFTHGAEISDPVVNVKATNSGRSPVTVKGWGLRFPNGQTMVILKPAPPSDPLPYRLEPGADANWYVPAVEVARGCAQHGVRQQDVTAFVNLADGRTISARQRGIGFAYEYDEGRRT